MRVPDVEIFEAGQMMSIQVVVRGSGLYSIRLFFARWLLVLACWAGNFKTVVITCEEA